MKRHIYTRVSTGKQTFDRQMQGIKRYFEYNGIDINSVDSIVQEHISGGKSYEDRKLKSLLMKCEPGDIIYVASTDRLGRSFSDMIKLMAEAKENGVKIIACKQNLSLDDESPVTKIMLSILAIMDEDERVRTSERNEEKAAWQKEQIAKHGYFIVEKGDNKGKKCYHLGRDKGVNLDVARSASIKSKQDKAIAWRENSKGYQLVRTLLSKGVGRIEIIERFNELHELDPENYSTPKGSPLSEFTLSKWANEIEMMAMVVR